jgi:site-specific recombinase XerD
LYTTNTGIILNTNDDTNDDGDFMEFFSDQAYSRSDYNYTVSYNYFLDYINADKLPFKELTREICNGYKNYLLNLNVKPHTAHHYFVAFKAIINLALNEGKIDYHPAKGIKIKYDEPDMDFLFIEEVKISLLTLFPLPDGDSL